MWEGVVIKKKEQGDEVWVVVDEAWFTSRFGQVVLHRGAAGDKPGVWRVAEIQCLVRDAPASIVVNLRNEDGAPYTMGAVGWYYSTAPGSLCSPGANGLPTGIVPGRAVVGMSNENGDVGFAMSPDAQYTPGVEIGPHALWVCGPSDVINGVGMLRGTNHHHFNVIFQWKTSDIEPPVEPPADLGPILDRLDTIIGLETKIASMLAQITGVK